MMSDTRTKCLHSASLVPYFASGEVDFMHCTRCGMVLRYPMPTDEQLNQIYARFYTSNRIDSGETNQESGSFAIRQYASYLAARWLRPGSRVVDYGCGSGALVHELRQRSIAADGVEHSSGARAYCESARGFRLLADLGSVASASLDAITMIEVIEHLPDPEGTITQLRERLKPGGLLFVTTPNRLSLRARIEAGHWREATKKFHVVLFDALSLTGLLRRAGFEASRILFSPVQRPGVTRWLATRGQQAIGVAGTLCMVARWKP